MKKNEKKGKKLTFDVQKFGVEVSSYTRQEGRGNTILTER
jgi:hypothetical protein